MCLGLRGWGGTQSSGLVRCNDLAIIRKGVLSFGAVESYTCFRTKP